jgi:phosphatidylserine/phosphatidylglycerophosphate/cardiolipin synthase-like enzyme/uncharacterized membrane protein YdjX (TVP38/TMEM64 family)
MDGDSLFKVGINTWRKAHASRVKFLVDGAAYYDAFAQAVERAQRSILLVGWDIDSRTRLCRPDAPTETLCELLNRVATKNKGLQVHILAWDFSMIYAFERQLFPIYHLDWKTHRRVHFRLDANHPLGAAHHQKVVVVDDAIAFSGGLDITTHRWDTRRHKPVDPRRRDANDELYKPFHDVQMAVDGEAARALGDMIRERWRRATGQSLRPPSGVTGDPWPPGLLPDARDVEVAIARTEPSLGDKPEVREVEALFLAMIERAKRTIYIENQYTTSTVIAEALAKRLEEEDGPEVVIVCPSQCSGWLECCTMGVLRAGFLSRLLDADKHQRMRVYYPRVDESIDVFIHSKVMVIDDDIVRIGSANISNRSMRVDTECDVAFEARGNPAISAAITRFRNQLLGEHLGAPAAKVAEAIEEKGGSLVGGIEALRGGMRTLVPLEINPSQLAEADDVVLFAADPEKPIDPEEFVDTFLFDDEPKLKTRLRRRAIVGLTLLALLAVAWSFTPLGQWINPGELSEHVKVIRSSPLAPFVVVLVFAVASLAMIPLNALILATGLAFGPLPGAPYALLGVLAGAATGYAAGRLLGRNTLGRLTNTRVNRLSRRLAKRGVLAIATARLIPIAPFTIVNLVAGASHIRLRQFMLGTFIGNLPGVILVTVFGPGVLSALYTWEPSTATVVSLIVATIALGLAALIWLRRRGDGEKGSGAPARLASNATSG